MQVGRFLETPAQVVPDRQEQLAQEYWRLALPLIGYLKYAALILPMDVYVARAGRSPTCGACTSICSYRARRNPCVLSLRRTNQH